MTDPVNNPRYALGQVVRCYRFHLDEFFGVVVKLPTTGNRQYRVRVSTEAFGKFVEAGVYEHDLDCSDEDSQEVNEFAAPSNRAGVE
jgi:hypothetical protein